MRTQRRPGVDIKRTLSGAAPSKPVCRLVGEDGNVVAIIGRVQRALKDAGQPERASEFVKRAFQARSYQEVLALCQDFVEVR